MKCDNTRCYRCEDKPITSGLSNSSSNSSLNSSTSNSTTNLTNGLNSSSSSICTSCTDPFPYLYNGTCLRFEECPAGTYATKSNQGIFLCAPCSSSCRTCVTTETTCTSCFNSLNTADIRSPLGEYLYMEKCLTNCPAGWSPDYTDDKVCKNFLCISPCNLCGGSPKYCYSCSEDIPFYYKAYCYDVCPSGSFMKPGGNKTCYECDINCKECLLGSESCTSCPEGKGLFQNQCLGICPQDYYMDSSKRLCIEQKLESYNWPAIFLLSGAFLVGLYVIISKLKLKGSMLIVPSLIVIGLPLELWSKATIFGNFWNLQVSMGVGLEFMVMVTNSVLGVILVFVQMGFFERKFKSLQLFLDLNNNFYSLTCIAICIMGPFYTEAFICGLLFFPKGDFARNIPNIKDAFYRFEFYSFLLALVQIALDIYILASFKILRDIFHVSYLNLAFNLVLVSKFSLEAIRKLKAQGYQALKA
jgi:hypothetical protein